MSSRNKRFIELLLCFAFGFLLVTFVTSVKAGSIFDEGYCMVREGNKMVWVPCH